MKKMIQNSKGAALVEYGILVGLIAVIAIAAVATLGGTIEGVFSTINATLLANNLS